jgi:hypothetical protein
MHQKRIREVADEKLNVEVDFGLLPWGQCDRKGRLLPSLFLLISEGDFYWAYISLDSLKER